MWDELDRIIRYRSKLGLDLIEVTLIGFLPEK